MRSLRREQGLNSRVYTLIELSCVRLFAALWTVARQTPLSMGFSRQKYWSGLPSPPSGDCLNPDIEPASPGSPVLADKIFTTELPGNPTLLLNTTYSCLLTWYSWKVYFHLKVAFLNTASAKRITL